MTKKHKKTIITIRIRENSLLLTPLVGIMKPFLLIILSLFLFACSPSVDSTQFYLLPEPMVKNTEDKVNLSYIAVLPVNMPDYLKKPQIVLRDGKSTQVHIESFHRWSEGLDEAFQRVMSTSLANELISTKLGVMPLRAGFPVNYKLTIDIRSFEGDLNKSASLDAYWIIQGNSKSVLEGYYSNSLPVGASYSSLIETQSKLVQDMAASIAKSLMTHNLK